MGEGKHRREADGNCPGRRWGSEKRRQSGTAKTETEERVPRGAGRTG